MKILRSLLKTHCRRRGWWYHVSHSSLFVCFLVSLSRCLSGRFNYEGLVPHKQYFAGILSGMSSCASYVSRAHDVIDDVTRSQSRSNFEIDISPSIFELERRSENGGHFEKFGISNTAANWPEIWKDRPKLCQKVYFMVMTSSMTSQGGLKISLHIHV